MLSILKNFSTGKMFTSLLFPRIEKKLEKRISEIKFLYYKNTGKQKIEFIDFNNEVIIGKNKITFEELTEGAIGQMLINKAEKSFPNWNVLGGIINSEGIIYLVFYNKNNQKIGDLKL
jgi:hypothetical protein